MVLARPFIDFTTTLTVESLFMFSDASKNQDLGFGAICDDQWMFGQWNRMFVQQENPSIEFLELFAVLAGLMVWIHQFKNKRIILYCDNESTVAMINNTSSKYSHCMNLIRLLVVKSLKENVRIFARHVTGILNDFSDILSRLDFTCFYRLQEIHNHTFAPYPALIPTELWPIRKNW